MKMSQDFTLILKSLKEEAAKYFGGLNGGASQEDLVQEAAMLIVETPALDPASAIRAARAALRAERATFGGKQQEISFAYLSAKIGGEDGLTIGETIVKDERAYLNSLTAEQRAQAEIWIAEGTLGEQVAAARIASAARAHGSEKAAQGAANAERGSLNDQRVLVLLQQVGGKHYGYAKKVQALLAEQGETFSVEAILMAVSRAMRRTEGRDPHSSRD
jgi:hypothetical protein